MLDFKESKMREEYEKLNLRLVRIVEVMIGLIEFRYGKKMTVTSVYREDLKSPHMYFRGIDLRPEGLTHEECKDVESFINLMMRYGKKWYQSVIYHNAGTGWHFHVQVKA